MSKKKKQSIWGSVALFVVCLSVAALVLFGLWSLFKTKETKIIETGGNTRTNALVCDAKNPQDAFFVLEGARDVDHEIKVTYTSEYGEEISYTYDADFGSPEAVKDAEARVHADYNIFMGKNGSDFSDQFMTMGDELKISIYAKIENLGTETSRVFFVLPEEYASLDGYKVTDLAKFYQKKGFSCEFDDD